MPGAYHCRRRRKVRQKAPGQRQRPSCEDVPDSPARRTPSSESSCANLLLNIGCESKLLSCMRKPELGKSGLAVRYWLFAIGCSSFAVRELRERRARDAPLIANDE